MERFSTHCLGVVQGICVPVYRCFIEAIDGHTLVLSSCHMSLASKQKRKELFS